MAYAAPAEAVASAARTASGVTAALAIDPGQNVHAVLNVTASAGTSPTLDVSLEWSLDEGATWVTASDAFAQVVATGVTHAVFTAKAPLTRVRWDITGVGASFTFDVRVFVTN